MSVRRDGAYVKKQRLDTIGRRLELKLKQNGGIYRLNKFLAEIEYEFGLNPKTVRRYLKTFELMETVKVDDKANTLTEWYDVEGLH